MNWEGTGSGNMLRYPNYLGKDFIFILTCVGRRFISPVAINFLPRIAFLVSDTFLFYTAIISTNENEGMAVFKGDIHTSK